VVFVQFPLSNAAPDTRGSAASGFCARPPLETQTLVPIHMGG
jgi:hypothetical protein